MSCCCATAFLHSPSLFPTITTTITTFTNHHINKKSQFSLFNFSKQRSRCSQSLSVSSSSSSLSSAFELPLLPFDATQVLVPSESKKLHLYEARYIALLEEALYEKKNLFVHIVLDPVVTNNSLPGASFAARYGCLVAIESVDKLDLGALVSIRGIGRVKIVNFLQADPYLKGVVKPMHDNLLDNREEVNCKVEELKDALHSLNRLEIKLKVPKEALLQTQTTNSLIWAENQPAVDCSQIFIPTLAERISFAAFQPISGSSESDILKLQQDKLRAMDIEDTLQRLEFSLVIVKNNVSVLAAKLAIQSVQVQ